VCFLLHSWRAATSGLVVCWWACSLINLATFFLSYSRQPNWSVTMCLPSPVSHITGFIHPSVCLYPFYRGSHLKNKSRRNPKLVWTFHRAEVTGWRILFRTYCCSWCHFYFSFNNVIAGKRFLAKFSCAKAFPVVIFILALCNSYGAGNANSVCCPSVRPSVWSLQCDVGTVVV